MVLERWNRIASVSSSDMESSPRWLLFGGRRRTLSVIPDDVLLTLPFAVLDPPGPGRFLVEQFAISTVPSISAWYRLRRSSARRMPAAVLAIADPAIENRSAAEWGESLAKLPSARREARRICRLIGGGSETLMGERATESSLKSLRQVVRDLFGPRQTASMVGGMDEDSAIDSSVWCGSARAMIV